MGKEIEVNSLEEMCDLMCDNKIPKKNQFPALPIEVTEFENTAVKLIKDGICTQGDLQNLMIFSHKISDAEIERRKKLEGYVLWEACAVKKKDE